MKLMRGAICLVMLLVSSFGCATNSVVTVTQRSRQSVAAIVLPIVRHGKSDGQFTISGTAFAISSNRLATAAHVVGQRSEVFFLFADDVESSELIGKLENRALYDRRIGIVYRTKVLSAIRKARVISVNREADVATLDFQGAAARPLRMGNPNVVKTGDDGIILGFPFGYNRLTVHRVLISYKGHFDGANKFQLDGIVSSGNSGGPLISLRSGKAIGVVHAKEGNVGPYLREIMSIPKQRGSMRFETGSFNLDIQKFSSEVSATVDSHIQMGIGYASFISHLPD